jgi:uncharacterized protein
MPAKNPTIPPAEPAVPVVTPQSPVPVVPPSQSTLPQPMTPGDERMWGTLAHLSTLLNLVTGFGGPIAALIIYLVYRDRSRFVAYHALQSMIFQLIWWYGGGVLIGGMWVVVAALSAILIGIVLIPFAVLFTLVFALLPLGAVIYSIIGAIQVNQGQDFKYWLAGDWVRGTLTGG